ncbi:MAG: hypothetical protein K1Y36_15680 [Blastocatellia bacterium]|nr:hypothetical protein [Blastocatellia bacterium]
MAFRKTKAKTQETIRWQSFCLVQKELLDELGLPFVVLESEAHFADFLMHGYLDHHDDPSQFTVDALADSQRRLLARLIEAYLAADFGNPGILPSVWGE